MSTLTTAEWLERITEHSGMDRDDVMQAGEHGADAGWPGFTYITDAAEFTARYRDDVWEMLADDAEAYGAASVAEFVAGFSRADMTDSSERFDNLLAWYVLETVGRALADDAENGADA